MIRRALSMVLLALSMSSIRAQDGGVAGFADHRGATLPNAHFIDERGNDGVLSHFFAKPFFLAFAYHSCPQLCGLVLGEFTSALRGVAARVGADFDVVVVSIDPADKPEASAAAKQRYVARYGGDGTGWHFLTGDGASIRATADAAGFNFVFDPIRKQFVHPAGIYFVRSGGVVAGHLEETNFSPGSLQALIDEQGDSASSAWNRLCGTFGFGGGLRTPVVMTLLRVGAGGAALILMCVIVALVRRRRLHGTPR